MKTYKSRIINQEEYKKIKSLTKTITKNVVISQMTGRSGGVIGAIRKSKNLQDYRKIYNASYYKLLKTMPKAKQNDTFNSDLKKSGHLQKVMMIVIVKESERLTRLQYLVLALALATLFTAVTLYSAI